MIYHYDDEFLINGVDTTLIENIEVKKETFVLNKLNVRDEYYLEKIVKSLVYMELAKMQLESEGMKEKYDIYNSEYKHFLSLAKNSSGGFSNIKLGRG